MSAEILVYRAAAVSPVDEGWVLAFWPHMHRHEASTTRGPRPKVRHGGWYPSRVYRLGWQAQIGGYRCYPVNGGPLFWTEILPPAQGIVTEGGDAAAAPVSAAN